MDMDYPVEIEKYMLPTVLKMESGCWLWCGGIKAGYGEIRKAGKSLRAHRVFYEVYRGKILSGSCIDHLCSEKHCVNPEHLEAVSREENTRRSILRLQKAGSARQTHPCPLSTEDELKKCQHGHPYKNNRRLYKGGTYCIACNRIAARTYKRNKQ